MTGKAINKDTFIYFKDCNNKDIYIKKSEIIGFSSDESNNRCRIYFKPDNGDFDLSYLIVKGTLNKIKSIINS